MKLYSMASFETVEAVRNSYQSGNANEDIFPCRNPLSDHMRNPLVREATFACWAGNISATSQQMAQAGLFYTGIGDKTKCFYCNGGLQNWQQDDDPMVEHAKWFPECEYVLQKRGVEFVSSISSQFPGLNRPSVSRTSHSTNRRSAVAISNPSIIRPGASRAHDIPPPSSSQNELTNALRHELTNNMRTLGYQEDLLRKVIVRRLQSLKMFGNAFEFLDAIQVMQNELNESEIQQTLATIPSGRTPVQAPTAERSVEIRIKEIEEERRCKICLDHESDCVFRPCGHLCTCLECAGKLRSCPLCRKRISKVVRVYTT